MIIDNIKNLIKDHAKKIFPQECCGFIVDDSKDIKIIKCKNIAKNPYIDFKISTAEFLNIKKQYNILYIYHSHPIDQNDFSYTDIISSHNFNIPIILYLIPSDIFKIYNPKIFDKYLDISFKYKENDCLSLIKKYCLDQFNKNLNVDEIYDIFEIDRFKSNLYDITKKIFIEKENFQEILAKDLKLGDILLLKNEEGYPVHFGIYLSNSSVLHQTLFQKSKIHNFYDKKDKIILGLRGAQYDY